ncbi:hypothetical protein [Nocardia araoensis]|uniref:hypothetical protein n=1 Tax=Nocardia araoensis TaxID=228600 RepID=UPI0012F65119|nr:hypothetical protein [Nocardia araoensis]
MKLTRVGLMVLAGVAVVAITAVALLSIASMTKTVQRDNEAGQDSGLPSKAFARDAALNAAKEVAVAVVGMDAERIDDSMRTMRSKMTGSLREAFDSNAERMKQAASQSKSSIFASPLVAALAELDDGGTRAKAIVVLEQRTSTDRQARAATYVLSLAKEGGDWKADDLQPIGTPRMAADVRAGPLAIFGETPAKIDNDAFVVDAATREVKTAAAEALQTMYTYDYRLIDEHRSKVSALLTYPLLQIFEASSDDLLEGVTATQAKQTVKVDPVGLVDLRGDRADLLLVVEISASKVGAASELTRGTLAARMVKVSGKWLLSELLDIA